MTSRNEYLVGGAYPISSDFGSMLRHMPFVYHSGASACNLCEAGSYLSVSGKSIYLMSVLPTWRYCLSFAKLAICAGTMRKSTCVEAIILNVHLTNLGGKVPLTKRYYV